MTVYSESVRSQSVRRTKSVTAKQSIVHISRLGLVNIVLFVGASALFFGNLWSSNALASKEYSLSKKREVVHELSTRIATREAELAGSQELQSLVVLGGRMGLVPGNGASTLFVSNGVAFSNTNASAKKQN